MRISKSQKLALLFSSEKSLWGSCRSISENFKKSYSLLQKTSRYEVEFLNIDPRLAHLDCLGGTGYFLHIARGIRRKAYTDLVFIDHHVDPLPLLLALKTQSGLDGIRYLFHLYGDFTLFADRWVKVGRLLSGKPLKFLCASQRHSKLVSFFECPGYSRCERVPFPIDTSKYAFSSSLREQGRKELRLSDQGRLLVYAGRISLQKEVHLLIEEFHRWRNHNASEAYLAIAGDFDDIGDATRGKALLPGFLYQKYRKLIQALPDETKKRILFLGSLKGDELLKLYCASDLFVSFSLYHDEDYGMAPAEALATGLPVLLTDWGGYAGFAQAELPCHLIPVHLESRGLKIDKSEILPRLTELTCWTNPKAVRKANGRKCEDILGIAAVAHTLLRVLRAESYQEGKEFSWTLEALARSRAMQGSFYREVYGNYVRKGFARPH